MIFSLVCLLLVHIDPREESQARNAATRIMLTLGLKSSYSIPLTTWKIVLSGISWQFLLEEAKVVCVCIYMYIYIYMYLKVKKNVIPYSVTTATAVDILLNFKHFHLIPSPRVLSCVTSTMCAGNYQNTAAVPWVHSCSLSGHLLVWS